MEHIAAAADLEHIIHITADDDSCMYDVYRYRPTSRILLESTIMRNAVWVMTYRYYDESITLREILPKDLEVEYSIKNMSAEQILDMPVKNIGFTQEARPTIYE